MVRKRACRTDKNHQEIVHCLRQMGFTVADTSGVGDGFPDIVVGAHGLNFLFEIKSPRGKMSKSQVRFSSNWRGQYDVIYSYGDALQIIEKARAKGATKRSNHCSSGDTCTDVHVRMRDPKRL